MKLYQKIARHISHGIALVNADEMGFFDKNAEDIQESLPSGSGFDNKIRIDYDKSTEDKIVLNANFHHIDDNGYYCGWSYHTIVITPSLVYGFNVKITGQDKRNIKEYISEVAYDFLNKDC